MLLHNQTTSFLSWRPPFVRNPIPGKKLLGKMLADRASEGPSATTNYREEFGSRKVYGAANHARWRVYWARFLNQEGNPAADGGDPAWLRQVRDRESAVENHSPQDSGRGRKFRLDLCPHRDRRNRHWPR